MANFEASSHGVRKTNNFPTSIRQGASGGAGGGRLPFEGSDLRYNDFKVQNGMYTNRWNLTSSHKYFQSHEFIKKAEVSNVDFVGWVQRTLGVTPQTTTV